MSNENNLDEQVAAQETSLHQKVLDEALEKTGSDGGLFIFLNENEGSFEVHGVRNVNNRMLKALPMVLDDLKNGMILDDLKNRIKRDCIATFIDAIPKQLKERWLGDLDGKIFADIIEEKLFNDDSIAEDIPFEQNKKDDVNTVNADEKESFH